MKSATELDVNLKPYTVETFETVERHRQRGSFKRFSAMGALVFLVFSLFNIFQDVDSLDKLELEYSILRTLPLRTYSKIQGLVCCIKYPWPLNIVVVGIAKKAFGISLDDASRKKVSEYRSINDLFTRKLAESARPIGRGIVSPVDGTVVYAGIVGTDIPQIKGVKYEIHDLLRISSLTEIDIDEDDLYQVVIYLAPSNYHRFHSFCDFTLKQVKHIPSQLFSVGMTPMRYLRGLLSKNERVVFSGESEWGYASLVAVGSTGVGSIATPFADITTNGYSFGPTQATSYFGNKEIKKGKEIGWFNLGSTVVLLFKAPKKFSLNCQEGPIQVGESIGELLA
ncbi:phosphatidylserine decarboxylase [Nematocida displodere]|uniref:phosphatidylserine decarboxylase n=1 Tax=Nematocida displodere TaxID=1805483 RepID=A0A177EAK5_9MICR|nr:phosphatidylserine decarboxylase [Nematocida displodere]